jgi:hypothetical protein
VNGATARLRFCAFVDPGRKNGTAGTEEVDPGVFERAR